MSASEWNFIWIRGKNSSHDTHMEIQISTASIFGMELASKDDAVIGNSVIIWQGHTILERNIHG